jgi:hypothetical protein
MNEVCFGPEDGQAFAAFLAQLVREGVTYSVRNGCGCWFVRLTGGF